MSANIEGISIAPRTNRHSFSAPISIAFHSNYIGWTHPIVPVTIRHRLAANAINPSNLTTKDRHGSTHHLRSICSV